MKKSFALAVTLAATAFLATGCTDNSNCQNGKTPNGAVCDSSSGGGGGSSGSLFRGTTRSGGFGEGHGGGGDAGG